MHTCAHALRCIPSVLQWRLENRWRGQVLLRGDFGRIVLVKQRQQRLVLCQVQWYSREQSHWLLSWVRTLAVLSLPTSQDISQQLTNSFRAIHPLLTSLRLPFAGTSKDTNSTQMHSPRLNIQSSNTAPSSLQSCSSTLPDQSCLEASSWF